MKELSIEERAKRYDEAIEKARDVYTYYCDDREQLRKIESIFPELKESEDERIRKALIRDIDIAMPIETAQKYIAWLEKQGEKKAAEEIEPTPIFRIGDVIKRKGKDYTFRVDRIQGGYYHSDRNHGAYFPIEDQDNWELVEQNPEWTPMDEQRVENLLAIIEGHGYPGEVAWLNSLRDRVQSKQEWSEEDEKLYNDLSDTYFYNDEDYPEETYKRMLKRVLDWMNKRAKFLRPQSHWKPSDAQMASITCAVRKMKESACYDSELVSLFNDLKKLKG